MHSLWSSMSCSKFFKNRVDDLKIICIFKSWTAILQGLFRLTDFFAVLPLEKGMNLNIACHSGNSKYRLSFELSNIDQELGCRNMKRLYALNPPFCYNVPATFLACLLIKLVISRWIYSECNSVGLLEYIYSFN